MRPLYPKDLVGIVLTPMEIVSDTLERKLGLFSVVIISLSAMIGSGLFVLPSLAYAMVGGGVWLAFVLAALVVIPGAMSQSVRGEKRDISFTTASRRYCDGKTTVPETGCSARVNAG